MVAMFLMVTMERNIRDYTTIDLKWDTYDALTQLGKKKDVYDDIVQKLLPKKMRRQK